ncbi:unnamed protein product, partial [Brassica oleracea]
FIRKLKTIPSNIVVSDCACISALLNDLWHELRLYEELLLN